MVRIALIPLLVLGSFGGCKTQQQAVNSNVAKNSSPVAVATIERTACFGRCPMYKATYFNNGTVHYEGKRFVEHEGLFTIKISLDEVKSIYAKADEMGYWEMKDRYDSSVTDFPSCITSVTKDGKTKNVYNRVDGPRSLKAFEQHLESLLEGKEFVQVKQD